MNNHIYYATAILLFLLIIVAFIVGRYTAPIQIQYVDKPQLITNIKYDTLTKEIIKAATIINKKADTTIIIDSTKYIQTNPFVAKLDTICAGDTVSAKFTFPQNDFYLKVLPKPIQFKEINSTIIKTEIIKIERPIWIDILSHSGAFLIGGGIGYLIGHK